LESPATAHQPPGIGQLDARALPLPPQGIRALAHWGQHWASARHQGIGAMGAAPGLVAPGIAAGTERDGAACYGDRCARVSRS